MTLKGNCRFLSFLFEQKEIKVFTKEAKGYFDQTFVIISHDTCYPAFNYKKSAQK